MLTLDGIRDSKRHYLPARQYFGSSLRQMEFDGLSITLTRYPADRMQPWHTHENPTFFLLIRGDFVDREWTTKTAMQPLTLVYHPTDQPHQSETGPGGAVGLNIELSRSWLARNLGSTSVPSCYRYLDSPEARLAALCLLVRAFSPVDPTNTRIEQDAVMLVRELLKPAVSLHEKPAPYWLPQVEAFLHDSLDEATGLRDAARAACLHPVYVARVFREHYGCSVGEYIRRLRILRAATYAIETNTNLADAAHEARFADQSHFTRLFSRETGMSPKVLLRIRAAAQL